MRKVVRGFILEPGGQFVLRQGPAEAGEDLRKQEDFENAPQGRGGSKQLTEDVFATRYEGRWGVVMPPYNFDRLLYLRELHPIHSAAVEQKAADIAGGGWTWIAKQEGAKPEEYARADQFLESPNPETSFPEMMQAVQADYETLGWGAIELVPEGASVGEAWYLPAHTLRACRDGVRFVQWRMGRFVWFKRYGEERVLDSRTGMWAKEGTSLPDEKNANELMVLRKTSARSSYYGLPSYLSAIGTVFASLAVRDYNISFFGRYAMPAWGVLVEGGEVTQDLMKTIETFFKQEVRATPHRTLVLEVPYAPVKGGTENRVKVKFERLSDEMKEASFRYYGANLNLEVLAAHRVPAHRIGWRPVGVGAFSLGSSIHELDAIYKRSVVSPAQVKINHAWNRIFRERFGVENWRWTLRELDIASVGADINAAVDAFQGGLLDQNESRELIGRPPKTGGEVHVITPGAKVLGADGDGNQPRRPTRAGRRRLSEVVAELGEVLDGLSEG
jgi:PBSX family phage portal protein